MNDEHLKSALEIQEALAARLGAEMVETSLRMRLAETYRRYKEEAQPIIDELVKIESSKPPPHPIILLDPRHRGEWGLSRINPSEAYWWPPEARNLEEAGACPVVKMTPAELRRRFPDPKG